MSPTLLKSRLIMLVIWGGLVTAGSAAEAPAAPAIVVDAEGQVTAARRCPILHWPRRSHTITDRFTSGRGRVMI